MPQIERWDKLPEGVRQHLVERMRDRAISGSYPKTFLFRGQAANGEAL